MFNFYSGGNTNPGSGGGGGTGNVTGAFTIPKIPVATGAESLGDSKMSSTVAGIKVDNEPGITFGLPAYLDAQKPVLPAEGDIVFVTDLDEFQGWDGTAWVPLNGGGGGAALEWDNVTHAVKDTISATEAIVPLVDTVLDKPGLMIDTDKDKLDGIDDTYKVIGSIGDIVSNPSGIVDGQLMIFDNSIPLFPKFIPFTLPDSYFSEVEVEVLPVLLDGQTVFTLSTTPASDKNVMLALNGLEMTLGVDYSVLGTTLTWLDYLGITLLTTDDLVARIFSVAVVTTPIPLSYLDTDNTLSANSDTKVPSQKAIKYYVDNQPKSLFIPANFLDKTLGHRCIEEWKNNSTMCANFYVPSDFKTVISISLIFFVGPLAAGINKSIQFESDYTVADGQLYNQYSESDLTTLYDFTGLGDERTRVEMIQVLSNVGPGSDGGISVTNNGTLDTMSVIGVEVVGT